jgi:2-oxoglutarate dehydrogenase E2 component (dihydrolipoamide succinyltransferase)
MARFELVMPKMGESIVEATIIKWHKNVGETIEQDETILEIATDKVDSEIPSPVSGKIVDILYKENEVVAIDTVVAVIATEGEDAEGGPVISEKPATENLIFEQSGDEILPEVPFLKTEENIPADMPESSVTSKKERFYSPLVKNIAKEEKITLAELDTIPGTGMGGRVTKNDITKYLDEKNNEGLQSKVLPQQEIIGHTPEKINEVSQTIHEVPKYSGVNGEVEIIEMDRMRKLISDHMIMSKKTSAHVTSFIETDVTNMVLWREKNKEQFAKKYGEKITFTPLFIEAIVQALKDFPRINCSVINDKIHIYKNLNIGMAAALPNGNLIVPVIKNADYLNLAGLTKQVNDLAQRARENRLKPEEIKEGTFTFTNIGTFGNVMGTPIINQPQSAILALGAIKKKPAVIETQHGDVLAIRHMMFMSLSYDHRIIDGFLGGSFLKRISDLIESFDVNKPL